MLQTDAKPIRMLQTDAKPIRMLQTDAQPIRTLKTDAQPIRMLQTDTQPIRTLQTDTQPIRTLQISQSNLNAENLFHIKRKKSQRLFPPTPTDSSIRIEDRPGMTVYVLRFGGFAGESEFRAEASRLTCTLGDSGPFQRKQYLCCSYDPPIKPYSRRNEVWFLQDEP
uniref:Heme-binding protein 1 n=1 Tax=Sinocyclocheilus rhinocerous TaxID=307959 RepID=A0A673HIF4_9TELE